MKDIFKKYFIPHSKNAYKPHFFRVASIASLFSLVLIIFGLAVSNRFIIQGTDLTALVLPRVLVDYANQDRTANNYHELAISPVLQQAAQLKANDMATKSYFAHTSPEGKTPWYWFRQAGYDFAYAGENLAVNFTDSVDVNTAWMNSPDHRENILNGNFSEIGIATADGFYQGRSTTFVVQLFGRPVAPATSISPIVNTKINTKPKTITSVVKNKTLLSTTASSSVLGASGVNELYIAVENKAAVPATTVSSHVQYSTWFEKVLLSPKRLLSFSYLVIALIIIIGLLLAIFIEVKKQHPYLILSAIFVLLVILVLLYLYQSVLFAPLLIA